MRAEGSPHRPRTHRPAAHSAPPCERCACRGPFYGSTRVVVDCVRTLPVGHAPTVVAAATVNHDREAMDRCAWCKTLVETPTTIRGVPYHWTCLPLLIAALKVARDAG